MLIIFCFYIHTEEVLVYPTFYLKKNLLFLIKNDLNADNEKYTKIPIKFQDLYFIIFTLSVIRNLSSLGFFKVLFKFTKASIFRHCSDN